MAQSYWDLSEQERAALTEEQVEGHTAYELMRAGVVRAGEPPELDADLIDVPEPDTSVYVVKFGYSDALYFRTPEQAHEAARNAVHLDSKHNWEADDTVRYIEPKTAEVEARRAHSEQQWALVQEQHEKAVAARQEHTTRKKEYDEQLEKQNSALRGLWSDWRKCRAKAREVAKVLATRDEYAALTGGDAEMAMTFLGKAFSAMRIADALEWSGESKPDEAAA